MLASHPSRCTATIPRVTPSALSALLALASAASARAAPVPPGVAPDPLRPVAYALVVGTNRGGLHPPPAGGASRGGRPRSRRPRHPRRGVPLRLPPDADRHRQHLGGQPARHARDRPARQGRAGALLSGTVQRPARSARPDEGRGPHRAEAPALDRRAGRASKGVDVALTLVRERQGALAEDPASYRPDDRWKALVTCPGGREIAWALLLFQGADAASAVATPLASGAGLACGNRVPLPGAFRLTGAGPAAVCFVGLLGGLRRSAGAPPTSAGAADIAAMDHAGAACVRLSSAEP